MTIEKKAGTSVSVSDQVTESIVSEHFQAQYELNEAKHNAEMAQQRLIKRLVDDGAYELLNLNVSRIRHLYGGKVY